MSSQRSSFLLWEKASGRPVTPLISWQDRRAIDWCSRHLRAYEPLAARTGLPLSPHYAGPKLTCLLSADMGVKDSAHRGRLCFGTLDTYLIWRLTKGRVYQTDLSMAARTAIMDVCRGLWDPALLKFYGIPPSLLPSIVSSHGLKISLSGGGWLTGSCADQAASLITAQAAVSRALAVNLGTGGFVMGFTGSTFARARGYLSAPVLQNPHGDIGYALEDSINAIGPALASHAGRSPELSDHDPAPELLCLPDNAGIGAPYWQASRNLTFSKKPVDFSHELLRRTVMEGIIFRVCRMALDFQSHTQFSSLVVFGGLSIEPFLFQGMAACSGLSVVLCQEKETSLWGAAANAMEKALPAPQVKQIDPTGLQGGYLKDKFKRWCRWIDSFLQPA
ncbi:MAG: FGGY family carbohydrate kinase [Thermodesulfobacteriota bacterium]|nr:FGGY family carbohydrate kinase [Thermodesulfobacteriota bacterium]